MALSERRKQQIAVYMRGYRKRNPKKFNVNPAPTTQKPEPENKPRAGKRKCIKCEKEFVSPDLARRHLCAKCRDENAKISRIHEGWG